MNENIKHFKGMEDAVFKKVFSIKENAVGYINLIYEDLNLKEDEVTVEEIEPKVNKFMRGVRFDIAYGTSNSNNVLVYVDMEMQNRLPKQNTFDNRKLIYAAYMITNLLHRGEKYDRDFKVRIIFFITDHLYKNETPIKRTVFHNITDDIIYHQLEITEIYINDFKENSLPKMNAHDKIIMEASKLLVQDDLTDYLNHENDAIRKVATTMRKLTQDEIEMLSEQMDFENQLEFEELLEEKYRVGREVGFSEGEEVGFNKGEEAGFNAGMQNKTKEVAKEMYKNGLNIDTIANCLKCSIEEIKEYIKA